MLRVFTLSNHGFTSHTIDPLSTTISKTQQQINALDQPRSFESTPCTRCGGNGYMKTSPNCYHTCLECLGRGLIEPIKKSS